jgi:hypothetical protein
MKLQKTPALASLMMLALISLSEGAIIPLTPANIHLNNTNTASFMDAGVTLTPILGSTPSTFNGSGYLGMDTPGTNVDSFNDPDQDPNNGNEEKLQFAFAPAAGLTQITYDSSRADGSGPSDGVIISGFAANPNVTFTRGGATFTNANLFAVYNAASGTLRLNIPGALFSGTLTAINFDPAASAGKTLLMSVTDTTQAGAQFAIRGISYDNNVPVLPPVITTRLPADTSAVVDTMPVLSVPIAPGAFPAPTYLWEFNNGSGFVTVSTNPTYTFAPGPATNGTYKVTISNSQGSDNSSTVVTAANDTDGINNQWEIDNLGSYLEFGALSDVDTVGGVVGGAAAPDGRTNFQEWNGGVNSTNPRNPDTDGDGLTDGQEFTLGTNPLLADTDGDGYSDGYEVNRTPPTLPNDITSSPGVNNNRNSIGISFVSTEGTNPNRTLSPAMLAGAPGYSQKNWNTTSALPNVASILTQAAIVSPTAATLVDSAGIPTPASFLIDTAGVFSATNNPQQPINRLLSGYVYSTTAPAKKLTIDINSVPYTRYDLVVYFIGSSSLPRGYIKELSSSKEYNFRCPFLVANGAEPTWISSSDPRVIPSGISENFTRSSYTVFRGLGASTAQLEINAVEGNPGVAAIQVVDAPDGDVDGMGDFYETSVGLNPSINDAANDLDMDGITNLDEHNRGTNPASADSDADGYTDAVETDTGVFASLASTGTDPLVADSDGDTLFDGVETNTGIFVSAANTGTNPLSNGDSDSDGYTDSYEIITTLSDPFNPNAPSGPNPNGFAIAFNANSGTTGAAAAVEFGPLVYAGAPGVAQKNWNRTENLANTQASSTGTVTSIASPNVDELVDSSGTVITAGVTFTAGRGSYSLAPETLTPYGRLFNSFIYGSVADAAPATPNTTVSLTAIPYSKYDVYVYFGSETNGRRGTITNGTITYSFTTAVNPATAGAVGSYVETTNTSIAVGTGFPQANYAVFRNQTSSTFNVTSTVGAGQNTLGIFGVQVVDTSSAVAPYDTWATTNITNPALRGANDDADMDGVKNLLEFALFSNPSNGGSTPVLNTSATGSNLTVTYLRANAATDVTYIAESSTDLVSWSSVPAGTAGTPNANTTEYTVTVPKGTDKAKFFRVRVVKP